MAVPEGLRGTGKLEVFEKARSLAIYTLKITANEKVFLPEHRGSLTDFINDAALGIFMDAWTANNVLVRNAEDYAKRKGLQEKAASSCNDLLALMQVAQGLFHLKLKRVKYWGDMTIGVRNLLRAWKESDYKRYSKLE